MCDYSLHAVASRPTKVGETLVTTSFYGTSTRGGRAPARGVDEGASRRTPGGMALRDRQTGWQGSLEWEAAFLESSRAI